MKKDKPAVSTSTKPRRKRWTRDDTELTLLGLPAAIWYAVFYCVQEFQDHSGKGFPLQLISQ